MSKEKPLVSIIILTWNGLDDTLAVLKDLEKQKIGNFKAETIVVDNGSTDGTPEKLRDFDLKNMDFSLMETGENLGFTGGNNVGIKKAYKEGAEIVILLNNDVILPKDWLENLIKAASENKDAGLLAPKMYFAKGFEFHKDRYEKDELGKVFWYAGGDIDWDNVYSSHRGVDEVDEGQYDKEEKTDYVNGACALIKRDVIKDVGYLDEKYFLYWEDADYSERARRAGYGVYYTPVTHLWHKVSVATGGSGSPSNDYYLIRNRLLFGMRYARLRTKLALVRDSVRLILKGRPWQRKGVIDFYLGRLGKGSYGK